MSSPNERPAVPNRKIQSPPPGSMGIRAYAKRRTEAGHPISHTAISKAIASGRIAAAVWRDEKGRPFIMPELADDLLDENTDPSAQRENRKGGRPAEDQGDGLFAEGGPEAESVRTPGPADERDAPNVAYNRSRAARETFEAQLARLKFLRETGEYVRAEVVKARCENAGIQLRDALRNIPARIAGELAAETNAIKIEERLTDEIDLALQGLAELGRPFAG